MSLSKTYFRLPSFFNTFPFKKTSIINIPNEYKDSVLIERNLLHLYKRFLRLSTLINYKDSTISSFHYKKLFLKIVRSRFKVDPIKLFDGRLILNSDIDISFKLEKLKQKYIQLNDEEEKSIYLKNIDNELIKNYQFFSINQFEQFYALICKSLYEEDSFLINFLNNSINGLENPSLVLENKTTNFNRLLFGTVLNVVTNLNSNHRIRSDWKSLFTETPIIKDKTEKTLSQQQYDYFKQLRDNAHVNYLKNEKNTTSNGPIDKYIFYRHLASQVNAREIKKQNTILASYVCEKDYKNGFEIVNHINTFCNNNNQMMSDFSLTHQFILSKYFKQKVVIPYITQQKEDRNINNKSKQISISINLFNKVI
ncbi:hypothetical protein HANVADRAFT_92298 [Hanseniaspora valbyensis NRRL Y-1626]|uniref:Uncharacterized protein n=1 Tax=Hanseniaspora valbyensis NRRL Y-1626 TaxID=766949 RepID=A0A1B7TIF1_9ASCO|nr:hypothetical protein HANVADRAFT_92298 [Hanseniaspora valbyensis NRRL Y-1626]